jgi:hypothetical protein
MYSTQRIEQQIVSISAEDRMVSKMDSKIACSSDLETLAIALSAAVVIDTQTRILYQNPPLLSQCLNSTETQIFNNLGKLASRDPCLMAHIKTALLSMGECVPQS